MVEPPGEAPPPLAAATGPTPPPAFPPRAASPVEAAAPEPRPTPPSPESPPPREDAPAAEASAQAPAAASGQLDIEFEHHLRHGNLQVWVDDRGVVDEDFDGRVTRKILALELRKGVVEQQLTLMPGPHEVRVQVRWDDNVKSARISGRFRPGARRRLEVQLSRLRSNLSLAWK